MDETRACQNEPTPTIIAGGAHPYDTPKFVACHSDPDKRGLHVSFNSEEERADRNIKKAIRRARSDLRITAKEAAERITEAGYTISASSYRNIESNTERSARVNLRLVEAVAKAFGCPVSNLVRPYELTVIPSRSFHNGRRAQKERGPVTKTEGGQNGRWPTFAREIVHLHKPDPEDLDCCGGCEMLWPCSTYEIIERLGFQNL